MFAESFGCDRVTFCVCSEFLCECIGVEFFSTQLDKTIDPTMRCVLVKFIPESHPIGWQSTDVGGMIDEQDGQSFFLTDQDGKDCLCPGVLMFSLEVPRFGGEFWGRLYRSDLISSTANGSLRICPSKSKRESTESFTVPGFSI